MRHLPPTGLKFQFFIVDIPTVNAFNTPGGYVFISRKLISFARTEDELAGVVAHELGHATVRHGAKDMSELFKKILNVTQVGDRKDITEKYNLFIERARTKSVSQSEGRENEQQLKRIASACLRWLRLVSIQTRSQSSSHGWLKKKRSRETGSQTFLEARLRLKNGCAR